MAMDATMGMYSTEEIQDADIVVEEDPQTGQDYPGKAPAEALEGKTTGSEGSGEGKASGFPEDDISSLAFSAEDDAAQKGQDTHLEMVIAAIKSAVGAAGIDLAEFKSWLFHYQNTKRPVMAYIGKIGNSYRFHLGKPKDTEALFNSIKPAIDRFLKEKDSK
jgi:hypothetical protein